ncbi:cytidine deaminase [Gordonia sp. ABSL1-1]|uniref:cytidine deaminase n=1 Tax=Gordonia sp. ABSL1-1 TaxID=3053923 RepID=UPI002573A4EC|nr:cytidine deaminase [Gordonia sp. ABSL1-1]MDL9935505.1 cytidine deaminase [Gordonia sp. ABSL1-1]
MTHSLDNEDQKLVVLARGALARAEVPSGAAVRDGDGRTYAGADVDTATLKLTGLQVALATALASGARSFEAAVLVNADPDDPGLATLREVSPAAYAYLTDLAGQPLRRLDPTT